MRLIRAGGVLLGLLVALCMGTAAMAEKDVPRSDRLQLATDVFTGRVTDVYSKTVTTGRFGKGTLEERLLYEVAIDAVENAGSVRVGDVLYVRAWRIKRVPDGKPQVGGMWGHSPLPDVGSRVRVFAVHGAYPDGNQTDQGFSAVYGAGFETLPASAK